jgi:hypothetical protein
MSTPDGARVAAFGPRRRGSSGGGGGHCRRFRRARDPGGLRGVPRPRPATGRDPSNSPAGDGPEVALFIDLATDGAPADPVDDVLWRVRDRALPGEVELLGNASRRCSPDDQGYSELMDRVGTFAKSQESTSTRVTFTPAVEEVVDSLSKRGHPAGVPHDARGPGRPRRSRGRTRRPRKGARDAQEAEDPDRRRVSPTRSTTCSTTRPCRSPTR